MKYALKIDSTIVVEALKFTGDNRAETRAFIGTPIVIRQGRFFKGDGYVVAGQWMVKFSNGAIYGIAERLFKSTYVPME